MALRRTGLTLIEVLAAIGLLATLLATVVAASARHAKQLRRAQDRLAAQEVADELLATWLIDQQGQINEARGRVAGKPGWEWRLSGRGEPGLEPFGLHVGRLDILRAATTGPIGEPSPETLLTIEFVSAATVTAGAAAHGAP